MLHLRPYATPPPPLLTPVGEVPTVAGYDIADAAHLLQGIDVLGVVAQQLPTLL